MTTSLSREELLLLLAEAIDFVEDGEDVRQSTWPEQVKAGDMAVNLGQRIRAALDVPGPELMPLSYVLETKERSGNPIIERAWPCEPKKDGWVIRRTDQGIGYGPMYLNYRTDGMDDGSPSIYHYFGTLAKGESIDDYAFASPEAAFAFWTENRPRILCYREDWRRIQQPIQL